MKIGSRLGFICGLLLLVVQQTFAQSKITIVSDPNRKPQGPLSRQVQELVGNLTAPPVAKIDIDQNIATWEILFATNRSASKSADGNINYGNQICSLAYGRSLVAIPRNNNRTQKSAMRSTTEVVAKPWFDNRLNQLTDNAVDHDVLVFVHGFNVNFDAAILRAAQIGSDMPFSGAIICYAWPSQGGVHNYRRDEEIVQQTVRPLEQFLADLSQTVSPGTRINILVHSMGNRAVLGALNELPASMKQRKLFHHVIFAAPDVGVDVFRAQVADVRRMAKQVTLYACDGDTALMASRELHRDPLRPWVRIERAGDSTKPLIMDGVQTIDVSAVDTSFMGHSYYGSNKTVLTDLLYLLKRDRDPDQSPWLERASVRNGTFWKMNEKQLAILSVKHLR